MPKTIADIPVTEGQKTVLKRAAQLRALCWTPVSPLPVLFSDAAASGTNFLAAHAPAWTPKTGIVYSAVRYKEKYVGLNVSLDTFLTAAGTPGSVLYTESLHGMNRLGAAFYGCVCSEYVSYCLDFPFQIDCQQFPHLDGMHRIEAENDLSLLRLCDVLNLDLRHTAIVTGIDRYEDGSVASVTVSEATPPFIISSVFTPEVFKKHWFDEGFRVLRYDRLGNASYTPSPYVPLPGDPEDLKTPAFSRELMPAYGHNANYQKGETVSFIVSAPAQAVTVTSPDGTAVSLPVQEGRAAFTPELPGLYSAVTEKDGVPAAFCLTDASVTLPKDTYAPGEAPEPAFANPAGDDRFLGYVVKNGDFAKVWGYPDPSTGVSCRPEPLKPGEYIIISLYENAFGRYCSHPCRFTVQ